MKKRLFPLLACIILITQVFLLKSDGNILYVYDFLSNTKTEVSKPLPPVYSENDSILLAKGIILKDRAELTKAMEDFCS